MAAFFQTAALSVGKTELSNESGAVLSMIEPPLVFDDEACCTCHLHDNASLGSSTSENPAPNFTDSPVDSLETGRQRNDSDNEITVYFVGNGERAVFDDRNSNSDSDEAISEGWSHYEQERFMAGLATIEAVTNLTFRATDNPNSDFQVVLTSDTDVFPSRGNLGYFYLPGGTTSMGAFNSNGFGWDEAGLQEGGLGFATIVHEALHGLGLGHTHDGQSVMRGVDRAFNDYGDFNFNQGINTTMSYNGGLFGRGNEAGPMAFDIAAIQEMYGANMATATGNNVYMIPNNTDDTTWLSIWDAGGTDALRYDGAQTTVIDLRDASLRYAEGGGGFVSGETNFNGSFVSGGFTIANGVDIEDAIGGQSGDEITGNDLNNSLSGRGGDDALSGGDGNDRLNGNSGNDTLSGGSGLNMVFGGSGNDTVIGGIDADTVFGGSGDDTLNGGGGNDALFGGRGGDTINGGNGDDRITGGMGQDIIQGNGGADVFIFEFASDSYAGAQNRDRIDGFTSGFDVIDLQNIEGLTFHDGLTFTGVGRQIIARDGLVQIDLNGDFIADMEIAVTGRTLTEDDFLL